MRIIKFLILLQIVAGFSLHAGIFGEDNRTVVSSLEKPWTYIGKLTIGDSICTGALVGPCQVLTAGHCVISKETQKPYPYKVAFIQHGLGQKAKVVHYFYGSPQTTKTRQTDWAIVIIDKPIGNDGFFGMKYIDKIKFEVHNLNIAGYNSDLYSGNKLTVDSTAKLHFVYASDSIMSLEADTYPGSSGAPIWKMNEYGRPFIYGVHVATHLDTDSVTKVTKQSRIPKYEMMYETQGVSTAAFWKTYKESLRYSCPSSDD